MQSALSALFYAGIGLAIATALRMVCAIALASLQVYAAEHPRDLKYEPVTQWPSRSHRWALVIGVDEYKDRQVAPLRGAANDARTLAQSLVLYAGFPPDQVILLATDQPEERQPTRVNILRRLSNLASVVPRDGLLLVSFSGHGMERNGQAFLLPSDAQVNNDIEFLEDTALSVTKIRDKIKSVKVEQVVVLLDACRNDPTGRSDAPNRMSEAYVKALNFSVLNREVKAFATLYAAQVGQKAYEYAEKKQGYFTWAVVEGLKGGAADAEGKVTLAGLTRFVEDIVPKRVAIDLGSIPPQKPFTEIAGYRATELVVAMVPTAESHTRKLSNSDRPSSAAVVAEPPIIEPRNTSMNSRDGGHYVWVPAGHFDMGCSPGDRRCTPQENPRHSVVLKSGFWLGETPVTVGAYKQFAAVVGKHLPPEPGYSNGKITVADFNRDWSLDDHPIVNVSWKEANEFCIWAGGRLPTEAEWEYAARGGRKDAAYPWGDEIGRRNANYGRPSCCGGQAEAEDKWQHTSPVKSFPPNGFGLFDMSGNVYQWVTDWYHENYYASSSATDPTGPDTGEYRIVRGGSWSNQPEYLRVSYRYVVPSHTRNHYTGFRCALDEKRDTR